MLPCEFRVNKAKLTRRRKAVAAESVSADRYYWAIVVDQPRSNWHWEIIVSMAFSKVSRLVQKPASAAVGENLTRSARSRRR